VIEDGKSLNFMKNDEKQRRATDAADYIAGVESGTARSALGGKPISASIIVLVAAILMLGGSRIQHSDTRLFVQIAGCIVGVIGLGGWCVSLREKPISAISASIIVSAAAILMLGGSYIQHSDTRLFVQAVGCIVGVIGLGGWFVSPREK
jgi:hypothetical protein